jgi:hypothetical protein
VSLRQRRWGLCHVDKTSRYFHCSLRFDWIFKVLPLVTILPPFAKRRTSTASDAVTPSPISPTTSAVPSIVREPRDCSCLRRSKSDGRAPFSVPRHFRHFCNFRTLGWIAAGVPAIGLLYYFLPVVLGHQIYEIFWRNRCVISNNQRTKFANDFERKESTLEGLGSGRHSGTTRVCN